MNPTILVDLDGTVADLLTVWLRKYNDTYHDDLTPEHITSFEIHKHVKPECGEGIYDFLDDSTFAELKPLPGAVDAVRRLSEEFNIRIVTAYQNRYPRTAGVKIAWVQVYLPFLDEKAVILAHDKHLIKGSVIIDDKPRTLDQYKKVHPGALTACITWPYNLHTNVDIRGEHWKDTAAAWHHIVELISWRMQ